ncbi:thioredoxin fold domain-containing protein [uncultured Tenacibaculum sp.]|uniref:thioredoxin family protein n=1 Tax=uncultured Tenacibaculum sp. TaxID=174713 RepID=UPI0026246AEE|nr:thioredoxin fold domain-containing protein [uncultured Tenacibaculum sp.]
MRNLFLLVAVFFYTIAWSQETQNDSLKAIIWTESYKDALKKVKKEGKPLLIYFKGSDWCVPCKKLDKELFSTEKFRNLSKENFVLYEADIPFNQDLVTKEKLELNQKLAEKYKVSSYPTLLFVDHKQKVIAYKKGLLLTEYYYPFFESVINKNRG